MQSEEIERSYMNWRRKDNHNEVVSTVLHDKWDNATHPEKHDEFTKTHMAGDSIPRFTPREGSEWETFMRDEVPSDMRIVDLKAHRQFVAEFAETVDHLNASDVIEFLNQSFEAEYTPKNNTFTRSFPWGGESTILQSDPTKREKQLLQFTLNKMSKAADEENTFVSPREVLQLFWVYDNRDAEQLIEKAISEIKPALETEEVTVTDDDGDEKTKTVVSQSAIESHREKMTELAGA
jgi:hypothetical protein